MCAKSSTGFVDMLANCPLVWAPKLQMTIACYFLFILLLATSLSGIFWTIDLVREEKREKTRFEREVNLNRDEIDKVQNKPQSLKR